MTVTELPSHILPARLRLQATLVADNASDVVAAERKANLMLEFGLPTLDPLAHLWT